MLLYLLIYCGRQQRIVPVYISVRPQGNVFTPRSIRQFHSVRSAEHRASGGRLLLPAKPLSDHESSMPTSPAAFAHASSPQVHAAWANGVAATMQALSLQGAVRPRTRALIWRRAIVAGSVATLASSGGVRSDERPARGGRGKPQTQPQRLSASCKPQHCAAAGNLEDMSMAAAVRHGASGSLAW